MRPHMFITSAGVLVSLSAMRCTFASNVKRACVVTACKRKKSRSSHVDTVLTKWAHMTLQTRTITAWGIYSVRFASRFWQFRCTTSGRKSCTISTVYFANGMWSSSTIWQKISTIYLLKSCSTKVFISKVHNSILMLD